jgi:pimeloyl-ACP methyl ester carboxylesterase
MTTIVLTHGAFHGARCFDPLVAELAALGIESIVPELPLTDLDGDEAAVREMLDRCDGPVTLLGHSYGGAVITVAGTHDAVEGLVYLAALAPDAGDRATGTLVEIGMPFIEAMRSGDDGVAFIDPALAGGLFYPDIDEESAAHWSKFLRPGNTGGAVIVREAAWRARPTTYIVCADDPIVLPNSQRAIAARIGAGVVEIAGDHSPMIARPHELADLLRSSMG